jgi:predicted dehydrogenase|tara:strand:+ start:1417 stop:2292 length:876 start_codon:yes stop_codon:yes gene_type:complete
MARRSIGISGGAAAAQVYAAGAAVLGWDVHSEGADVDIIVSGPLASTLALADASVQAGGRRAFGWPLITTVAVQELLRRAPSVGAVTDLSSRSTRPAPSVALSARSPLSGGVLLSSAHDQIALTMLVARLVGMGAPQSVTASVGFDASGLDNAVDMAIEFVGGLTARVHADWQSESVTNQEFQLAGEAGVLRSETDPRLSLEFNGERVRLPAANVADEQHRPLHEAGVVAMLTTIATAFDAGTLPYAFTLAFGRDVLEVIVAAYASAGHREPVALPFDGDRSATPQQLLAS